MHVHYEIDGDKHYKLALGLSIVGVYIIFFKRIMKGSMLSKIGIYVWRKCACVPYGGGSHHFSPTLVLSFVLWMIEVYMWRGCVYVPIGDGSNRIGRVEFLSTKEGLPHWCGSHKFLSPYYKCEESLSLLLGVFVGDLDHIQWNMGSIITCIFTTRF